MRILKFTAGIAVVAMMVSGCATTERSPAKAGMKMAATESAPRDKNKIYANSSAELAEQFVGRHVDELPDAESSTKAVQDGDEVVCKVVERTHTRLRKKKVCAPRKEWDLYKTEATRTTRDMQVTRRQGD